MNVDLLENAVKFHGKKLFDMILRQNNCEPSDEATTTRSSGDDPNEEHTNTTEL